MAFEHGRIPMDVPTQSMTRRALLRRAGQGALLASAGAALVALEACASSSNTPSGGTPSASTPQTAPAVQQAPAAQLPSASETTGNPTVSAASAVATVAGKAGGTLTWGRAYKGRTKDPHQLYSLQDMVILRQAIEPLVELDAQGKIVPILAESWQVSGDGLTWTFNLRKGVKFNDGTPFTAEAVKASVERCKDNAKSGYAFMFTNYQDTPVTIIDTNTVQLKTKAPEPAMLNNLAVFYILPPDAGANKDMSYDKLIGTGPYKVVEYDIDRIYRYEANPNYWRPGFPKVPSVSLKPIIEQSSLAAATTAGELDLVEGLSPDNAALFRNKPGFDVVPDLLWRLDFLILNQAGSIPALKDAKVRQAMAFAVDRTVIARDIMGGTSTPWSTYPPKGLFGATDKYPANPFDLAKAKELMKASSAPDGFKGIVRVPPGASGHGKEQDITQFVAQQLQQIGIHLDVQTGEQTAINSDFLAGKYDIGYLSSVAVTGDAGRYLNERLVDDKEKMSYHNPAVIDLIGQVTTTIDLQKRQALYDQLQAKLWDDMAIIYLQQVQINFIKKKNVGGFQAMPNQVYNVTEVTVS